MRPGRKGAASTLPIGGPPRAPRGPAGSPVPPCPFPLDEVARGEWDRYAPILAGLGRLSDATAPTLAIYCQAFARYQAAAELLALDGPVLNTDLGGTKAHPAAAVVKEATATMLRVLACFGCTPADLARLNIAEAAPPDAFAEFLEARKRKA